MCNMFYFCSKSQEQNGTINIIDMILIYIYIYIYSANNILHMMGIGNE